MQVLMIVNKNLFHKTKDRVCNCLVIPSLSFIKSLPPQLYLSNHHCVDDQIYLCNICCLHVSPCDINEIYLFPYHITSYLSIYIDCYHMLLKLTSWLKRCSNIIAGFCYNVCHYMSALHVLMHITYPKFHDE